jgi:hypothetical protein
MIEFLRKRAKLLWPGAAHAAAEIQFHPSSYADPQGRLFLRQGRLYRGVPAASVAHCTRLFESGAVEELVQARLLVPTKVSALRVEGYPLVLEHEYVPHVSYPYEWSAEMMRAAALHTLAVLEALAKHGLTLKDAHGWNVVFVGCRPVFVDFGSIVAVEPGAPWRAEREFQEYFLHPLAMMGAGHDRIARALLRDFEQGISLATCASIVGLGVPQRPTATEPYAWYRELISGYDFRPEPTPWSEYYKDAFPPLSPDPALEREAPRGASIAAAAPASECIGHWFQPGVVCAGGRRWRRAGSRIRQ